MRISSNLYSRLSTDTLAVALITGKVTFEEFFTYPESIYLVSKDAVYYKDYFQVLPDDVIPWKDLPKSLKSVEQLDKLVNKPLIEFDHIQDMIKLNVVKNKAQEVPPQASTEPTPTPTTTKTPTCQDMTLEVQYEKIRMAIVQGANEELINETKVIDELLQSSASPCSKRGRLSSFIDMYNALPKA